MNLELVERIRNLKMIIMDVDGTLTDGTIIIDANGVESKHFNVKDGMGINLAHNAGYVTGIISARESNIVLKRSQELNIAFIKQGVTNKKAAFEQMISEAKITPLQAAFIGDDVNDIEVCKYAGLSFAVNDASEQLKKTVDIVLNSIGGRGAVREAIELILYYGNLNRG